MAYKLRILEAADRDIAEAIQVYEIVRKGLSMDFELCLEEGYADILRLPLGYQVRYKDVRIKFIRRFPYGIHYRVKGDMITVISVFRQTRDPKNWFQRLKKE